MHGQTCWMAIEWTKFFLQIGIYSMRKVLTAVPPKQCRYLSLSGILLA